MDAGQIVLVSFPVDDNPGKRKYAICVDPNQGFFFLINSNPRYFAQADIEVKPADLTFLENVSYINTGEIFEFNVGALDVMIDSDEQANLGMLPAAVREQVRMKVEDGKTLTPRQRQAILNHL